MNLYLQHLYTEQKFILISFNLLIQFKGEAFIFGSDWNHLRLDFFLYTQCLELNDPYLTFLIINIGEISNI